MLGKVVTKCRQCGGAEEGAKCDRRNANASAHRELDEDAVSAAVVGSSSAVELTSVVINEEDDDDDDDDDEEDDGDSSPISRSRD